MAIKTKGTILVGIDFTKSSENALNYAILLAKKSGYGILLFHVFDTPIVHANSGAYFVEYASLKQNFTARLEDYKSKISVKYPDLAVDVLTTFNSFKGEVEDLVKKKKINFVVIGLETKTKISKFIYGTTGIDISGKIDCPIIIVPEKYKDHKLETITLALDNKHKQHAKELKQFQKFSDLFSCKTSYFHVRTEDELIIEKAKNKELNIETIRARDFKEKAAECLKLTSKDMFANKLIDGVVPEPLGGAHRNMEVMAQTIKDQVIKDLSQLKKIDIDELVNQRIEKFCSMGVVQE